MRRYLVFFLALLFIAGCSAKPKPKDIIARVNDYEIARDEFDTAFKSSSFGLRDTPEARKEYLDNLVNQKLILQEAQKKNLDKIPGFLKAIERFWEQTLLKIAIDNKTIEISRSTQVTEEEVKEAYDKLSETERQGKDYKGLHDKLKIQLKKAREARRFESWLAELRKKADITVNYGFIKKDK